ncbi:hypothetical protein RUM44_008528 [Polyplax serrata]|uniref:Uncharacterized protein n=1 Tax=Polyplax serrata TaxID=468196 RepID=A0ABR1B8H0_POLSC
MSLSRVPVNTRTLNWTSRARREVVRMKDHINGEINQDLRHGASFECDRNRTELTDDQVRDVKIRLTTHAGDTKKGDFSTGMGKSHGEKSVKGKSIEINQVKLSPKCKKESATCSDFDSEAKSSVEDEEGAVRERLRRQQQQQQQQQKLNRTAFARRFNR